jgi:hypothetical protein
MSCLVTIILPFLVSSSCRLFYLDYLDRRTCDHDIKSRFHLFKYDKSACEAAIRGEEVLYALGLPLTLHCIVRGIRYHHGFGEEFRGMLPVFTRALNARSIMSDRIPSMSSESEFPYCIWHPQVAAEECELVRRLP